MQLENYKKFEKNITEKNKNCNSYASNEHIF